MLEFIIPSEYDGITVEKYLKGVRGMSSRTLRRLKHKTDGIMLNGTHVRTIDIIRDGDRLALSFSDDKPAKPTDCIKIDIAYEDGEYIVCNKSGDMPTHPSASHSRNTLANGVAAYFSNKGKACAIRPINRLDLDTSGLVVIAKHQFSASLISKNLRKTYYALVTGIITSNGTIEAPIKRRDDDSKYRIVSPDGEYALTSFYPIASSGDTTLVKVILKTGRTHQIRVHFAHIGHPLVGDRLYGNCSDIIDRQCLHCGAIGFYNKISDKNVEVCSYFPEDFKKALRKFGYDECIINNEVCL